MVNFVYLVGDRETGEALIIDPAYGIDDLLGILAADGMRCVGALATHFHPDHVGGSLQGWSIEGITRLLEVAPVPIHVQADEVPWVERSTGVGAADLVAHAGGDVVQVGDIPITLVHTPGHTPGSQCFLVDGKLIAGDTLFLDGCGRTDFPGSDPAAMYESLMTRLARVPDDTVLYPGPLLLTRAVGHHGLHPGPQLRVPAEVAGAVDDHVRQLRRRSRWSRTPSTTMVRRARRTPLAALGLTAPLRFAP